MSENKNQGRKSLQLAIAVAVLIGAIIMLIAVERASRTPESPPPETAPTTGSTTTPPSTSAASPSPASEPRSASPEVAEERGPTPVRAFFAGPAAPPPAQGRSPLADALHASDSDPRQDLAIVTRLFATFHDHFHELPVGSNAEITAALAGDNSHGLAVIPADHPAINARGELVDRWGSTLFFHQIGGGTMEIRSAGPDRRMHTADDLVHPQPAPLTADLAP